MTPRNKLAIVLALVSLVLLWPGLVQPVLTIRATMELFGNTRELSNETRSVISAIQSLHNTGNNFVAGLIVLFSVLVPVLKAALLVPIFALRGSATSYRLYGVVQAMSKWSMADVFAVGMLIALLVGKGTANLSAVAGTGFYCFAAYCLVSNAAFQSLKIEPPVPVAPTSSGSTSSPFSARS
ncbi:paraquat-inducible protein A [Gemmatimonas sp.]|uniref:paraquat-inducible protein A n=1 Tax=Gemmatimonas sp. TaxID=1962908 RepID=UPI00286BFC99|nr:paraquat-inducible protein A [Gemmatimonas sp.]